MAIPDNPRPKDNLRKHMRRLAKECTADSTAVRGALDDWLLAHPEAQAIAVFFPLTDEPDLTEIIIRHPRRSWLYPKVRGEVLDFHRVKDPATELKPGAYGILEPAAGLERIEVDRIDVFICPGLAFDARGGRLGRGKGFYDRTLARARHGAWKIGVCFPYQLVEDTFPEAHDVRMDEILS